jgi:hypothetical protein
MLYVNTYTNNTNNGDDVDILRPKFTILLDRLIHTHYTLYFVGRTTANQPFVCVPRYHTKVSKFHLHFPPFLHNKTM